MPKNHDMSGDAPATSKDVPPWVAQFLAVFQQQNEQVQQQNQRVQQQNQALQQQMQQLLAVLVEQKLGPEQSPTKQQPPDAYGDLMRDLPYFNYDEDDDSTFDAWYKRYGPVIDDRGSSLSDDRKRNLIIDKLDKATYKTYSEHVLPLKPRDIDLPTTVETLAKLFGPKKTLIRRRFEFLQSSCPPMSGTHIPYRDFGNTIKKKFEEACMKDVDSESLKCLVFVSGLTDSSHSEMRLRLLNKMNRLKESDPLPVLDDFISECETFVTLRSDNRTMETKEINAAHQRKPIKKQRYPKRVSFRDRSFCEDQEATSDKRNRKSFSTQRTRTKSLKRKLRCKNVAITARDARTYMKVLINGEPTRLQLDTGADITMISRKTWRKIGSPILSQDIAIVKTADGSPMHIHGCFDTEFTIFDRNHQPIPGRGKCYVTETTDLLGLEWCMQMPDYRQLKDQYNCRHATATLHNNRTELIAYLRTHFANVFAPGLGRCTKTKAKLFLKPGAQPVYRKKRPVPFASQPAVDAEIDRLVQEGVLTAVDHSDWAAPIVVVKKSNGSIRLCADYSTGLNDSLSLHQHPLPTTEEIFTKLNGGQLFSQIDLADAYLQIEVDEVSKELLTINTHRGLFRYNRLPFGVKSAPGIFQQIIDSMIAGLDGVAAYLDDIIVTGRTTMEHLHNLEALLRRIEQYGFRVREEKCHFMMTEIHYLGNIIDASGRRPDPEKIQAITKMPRPDNVAQLRSFLGMLNYYGTFIPEMRQLRAPLDALLKKDVPFKWSQECQTAFEKAKEILTSPLLFTHYDPKLDLIVAADASDYGIGAVILHRFPDGTEKAISHASRNLTEAEKKYGQIEKEGLALVYAVRKFHRYLLGRQFTLLTDHKPLLSIFGSKKGLPAYTANRLLRWSLILRGYDFKIEYRKTTDFGQADALSRLIAEQAEESEDIVIAAASHEAELECKAVKTQVPIDANLIAEESVKDETLKDVIQYVREDKWPKKPPLKIKSYFALRHSLSLHDDCLFFGPRIVIPSKFQNRVLALLHEGHPGMSRMKSLARCYVYWTNITKDIENFVRKCTSCQEVAKAPVKTELFTWLKEEKPWSRIHVDFAGPIHGKMFLIVVDAYSKWPEVIEMSTTTSKATIRQLSRLFAQFGYPETLVSDNGSQFTSTDFTEFCKANGIAHLRSPPYHPQSNGQAERFVDTFKRALEKLKNSETTTEAVQKFLLSYRSTPCTSSPEGRSPAENFLRHQLRTPLTLLTMPRHTTAERDKNMEDQFNRHHGTRPKSFEPEDTVWVMDFRRGGKKWIPAKVLSRHGHAVYDVLIKEAVERRHANQMRPRIPEEVQATLLDTVDSPLHPTNPTVQNQSPTPVADETSSVWENDTSNATISPNKPTEERQPRRIRQPPSRLQVKPSLKSYT
ncbi:hypothetical protein V3C99_008177 [Haemonchus contortus]